MAELTFVGKKTSTDNLRSHLNVISSDSPWIDRGFRLAYFTALSRYLHDLAGRLCALRPPSAGELRWHDAESKPSQRVTRRIQRHHRHRSHHYESSRS